MKKKLLAILFSLAVAGLGFGQWSGYYVPGENQLDGGLGMTWIDNQAYYTISFQPDISIGKIGIGLNISLLYNTNTGKIRSKDWDKTYDYTRILRYLRYGHKGEPVYGRIGALDIERIGHGFILNFYNNQINYDERKIGLAFDYDFGLFGFESLTNNLGRVEVLGGRGYVRPLFGSEIPILKNFAVGASYITDQDPDSWKGTKDDKISVYGADVELPIIKSEMLMTMLYADYAKIKDYGSGQTVGIRTDFNALWGFLGLSVNFERRFLGKEFIAPYFSPFYEVLRNTTIGEIVEFYKSLGGKETGIPEQFLPIISNIKVNQEMLLPMMNEKRNAWYGGLYLNFLRLVTVMGSYQKVDQYGNSGQLHLGAGLSPNIPLITAEATYDKRNIGTFKDIRTLDYRSVARVGVGYKVKPYLLLYLDYIWNFVWDEGIGQFKPQERFQPRLAFRYQL